MNLLLILPIIIPQITGVIALLLWHKLKPQRIVSVIGSFCLLLSAIFLFRSVVDGTILTTQIGGWEAPIGITLVADVLSAVMVLLASVVGFAVTLFSLVDIDRQRVAFGYYPLTNFLMMGICGAFLTGDLFNLYVWFEVLLISSFVLLGLGGDGQQLQGTMKYVVINLVSSTIFLTALGIVYGVVGTLNMADVAEQMALLAQSRSGLVTTIGMLFLVAFGIKAALFPFYFWLPASYHTPPIAISALFAGLLTKVGVYALIRVFTLIFIHDLTFTHTVLMWIAGLTMVSGILGAIDQTDIRRLLSFHIVSQIGFMIMGLSISGLAIASGRDDAMMVAELAMAGAVFYIIHHIVVKSTLFLIAGVIDWLRGTFNLGRLGGLLDTRPYLAIMFFIAGVTLSGIPPSSGFWAKFLLMRSGLLNGNYWLVLTSAVVSLFTLYSMMKIWRYAFWGDAPEKFYRPIDFSKSELFWHLVPITILVVLSVSIAFSAETVYTIAQTAAKQLLTPSLYIDAVFQGGH